MKLFYTLLLLGFSSAAFSQISPQSKKITKKFFPDAKEIENVTPALQKNRGFTDDDELYKFLNDQVAQHPTKIQLRYIGESQKGKKVPMVTLSNPSEKEKIKVWMQGGLHGNEPASTEGMLYLIYELLNKEAYTSLLDDIELVIVPMANIDGYLKNSRYAANGLDLNRDQTKLMAKESVFLKQAFSDFNPEVGVDFHEYTAFRKDYSKLGNFGIAAIYDVMFLYSGNLNVPENLRKITENIFVKNAEKVLNENQLKHHPYVSTTDYNGAIHFNQGSESARSSATNYALTNTISSLIEIRGVGIGKTSFKRRIKSTFLVAISYLKTSIEHKESVKKAIIEAQEVQNNIIVTSDRSVYKGKVKVIDLDTAEAIELEVTFRDALQAIPNLTRKRPKGYLIEASQEAIIQKLQVLGATLEKLKEDKEFEVESYEIIAYDRDSKKYEEMNLQAVETAVKVQKKTFEKGTYFVSLNQKTSNLIVEVLEPEAPNSFVSFGVLETFKGAILPIYRILNEEN
jgi:uncharacterized protein with HEPN domain